MEAGDLWKLDIRYIGNIGLAFGNSDMDWSSTLEAKIAVMNEHGRNGKYRNKIWTRETRI